MDGRLAGLRARLDAAERARDRGASLLLESSEELRRLRSMGEVQGRFEGGDRVPHAPPSKNKNSGFQSSRLLGSFPKGKVGARLVGARIDFVYSCTFPRGLGASGQVQIMGLFFDGFAGLEGSDAIQRLHALEVR